MLKRSKTNIKYIFVLLTVLLFTAITFITDAKYKNPKPFFKLLTATDTTAKPDTIIKKDSAIKPAKDTSIIHSNDTLPTNDTTGINDTTGNIITIDTLNFSKDSIDAPINYSAEDSGVLIIDKKKFLLYGKAKANYTDIALDANTIIYDQATNVITAYGGTDTSKGALNKPQLTEGQTVSISDTIKFNMKNPARSYKKHFL
jgi:hypothetical protein